MSVSLYSAQRESEFWEPSLTFAVIGGLGEVDRVDGACKCAAGLEIAGRKHDVALGISTRLIIERVIISEKV